MFPPGWGVAPSIDAMRFLRAAAVVVVATVVLAGCSDDPAPEPEPSPSPLQTVATTPAPTASEEAACPNESVVVADPMKRLQAPVRRDVDGDVAPEDVYIASDPGDAIGCQAFIVVAIDATFHSVPIWEAGPQSGLPQPSIHGFVDIDGEPGVEILVNEAAGASTQFVGAFVFADGSLSRITVPEGAGASFPEFGDLFPFGGSVGHLDAVDCADDGTIVVSAAVPGRSQEDLENGIYTVARTFFRLDGAELRKEDTTREQVPVGDLEQYPEFAAGPFGSC